MNASIYVNGRIMPLYRAKVSVCDRGFLYGDGLFETLRSYDGALPFLREHLCRLTTSLRQVGIPLSLKEGRIDRVIRTLLQKNRLRNAYIRISVTRGTHRRSLTGDDAKRPTLVILTRALARMPAEYYRRGAIMEISPFVRLHGTLSGGIKSLSYQENILTKRYAVARGAFDALFLSHYGRILESATANFFRVRRGRVTTPPLNAGILAGVTRKAVIRLAKRRGYVVEERDMLLTDLRPTDELFLTNSLIEVMPIRSIRGRYRRRGAGFPVTERLRNEYRTYIMSRSA